MNRYASLICLLLGLGPGACSLVPEYNPYQLPPVETTRSAGAVSELQFNAIAALGREAWDQALDYLQRAIRIEPRNPVSWHYLAQTYWYRGDNQRCLEMVERSFSYSSREDNLDEANEQLRARCQQG
jgi:Tfp pilus assembly protein PilF